jgi:hypothetical protein
MTLPKVHVTPRLGDLFGARLGDLFGFAKSPTVLELVELVAERTRGKAIDAVGLQMLGDVMSYTRHRRAVHRVIRKELAFGVVLGLLVNRPLAEEPPKSRSWTHPNGPSGGGDHRGYSANRPISFAPASGMTTRARAAGNVDPPTCSPLTSGLSAFLRMRACRFPDRCGPANRLIRCGGLSRVRAPVSGAARALNGAAWGRRLSACGRVSPGGAFQQWPV